MASVVVRGLNESVKQQLAAQAQRNGRSMEAEIREILTQAAYESNIGLAFLRLGQELAGGDDLPIPERNDRARVVEFE